MTNLPCRPPRQPLPRRTPLAAAVRTAAKANAARLRATRRQDQCLVSAARTGASTNAAPAAGAKSGIAETIRSLQTNPAFYPAVGVVFLCLCLAVVLVVRLLKAKGAKAGKAAQPEVGAESGGPAGQEKGGKVTIHSCNVLQVGAQARQLWQFDARGRGFVLNREQTSFAGEPLPARLVTKDWRSLWQRKLNVAWLPPERVFLRVAQFPAERFRRNPGDGGVAVGETVADAGHADRLEHPRPAACRGQPADGDRDDRFAQ